MMYDIKDTCPFFVNRAFLSMLVLLPAACGRLLAAEVTRDSVVGCKTAFGGSKCFARIISVGKQLSSTRLLLRSAPVACGFRTWICRIHRELHSGRTEICTGLPYQRELQLFLEFQL